LEFGATSITLSAPRAVSIYPETVATTTAFMGAWQKAEPAKRSGVFAPTRLDG
jgi:hypothetical protein